MGEFLTILIRSQLVPADSLRVTAVHGDFSAGNVMVSDGRIVVMDIQRITNGAKFHDVGYFHFWLEFCELYLWYRKRDVARFTRAFLAGYDPKFDLTAPLFRLFQLQHLVLCFSGVLKRFGHPLGQLYDRYCAGHKLRCLRKLLDCEKS